MLKLGEYQSLKVVKKVDFGVYLSDEEKSGEVLLPIKQVPKEIEIGDDLPIFLYKDSEDRLISTVRHPKLTLGEVARLKVVGTSRIGAFLDWGLEKDLLLPFREMTYKVKADEEIIVALYIDKSQRLCATMKVYPYLSTQSPYQKDDIVSGHVYQISQDFGVFVAVDDLYSARIPAREVTSKYQLGDLVMGQVAEVREDGKLELRVKKKAYLAMEEDAAFILNELKKAGGQFPFGEKESPEFIKERFQMTKSAFKRGIGRLLKEDKIYFNHQGIALKKDI